MMRLYLLYATTAGVAHTLLIVREILVTCYPVYTARGASRARQICTLSFLFLFFFLLLYTLFSVPIYVYVCVTLLCLPLDFRTSLSYRCYNFFIFFANSLQWGVH